MAICGTATCVLLRLDNQQRKAGINNNALLWDIKAGQICLLDKTTALVPYSYHRKQEIALRGVLVRGEGFRHKDKVKGTGPCLIPVRGPLPHALIPVP
eukprot:scaffold80983_cov33-Prasinocladus_malaysianus.AAC.1